LFAVVAYWFLAKRFTPSHWKFFFIHLAATVLLISYMLFPFSFKTEVFSQEDPSAAMTAMTAMANRLKWVPYVWCLFLLTQVLFAIYFFRSIRKKKAPSI
jgi:hypothetical protein